LFVIGKKDQRSPYQSLSTRKANDSQREREGEVTPERAFEVQRDSGFALFEANSSVTCFGTTLSISLTLSVHI
jgi:hypothetical protein